MGVSGSGKTTVGRALAKQLQLSFVDGDDFHPKENIIKMEAGQALNDDDRAAWLASIHQYATKNTEGLVIACSALKEKYRQVLAVHLDARFFLLTGTYDLIYERLNQRQEHFMPSALLQSQFDTLEITNECISIAINQSVPQIVHEITNELSKSSIGVIGMGVMGKNLARNIARNGFSVSLYNRRVKGKEEDIALQVTKTYPELNNSPAFEDMKAFVESIQRPRKILMMVYAGAVDEVIDEIQGHCSEGDIIIDGGNSFYKDTEKRYQELQEKGIEFLGMGVSGGELGALNGPAIMPGCSKKAYTKVSPILGRIAAKNKAGDSCCQFIGTGGSGHFVKMVHNGIEYAEMQLLAECYDIMKATGMDKDAIHAIFSTWSKNKEHESYLLEITSHILKAKKDENFILDEILDVASSKGTGAWASIEGIRLGIPFNIISSALYARSISNVKSKRETLSTHFESPKNKLSLATDNLRDAYQCARILNHIQGFEYIIAAGKAFAWELNLSSIAQVWTGGCIIRSGLMFELMQELKKDEQLFASPLLLQRLNTYRNSLKEICQLAMGGEIPIPTFSACLNFLNGIKQASSSANLIQAQRDYFGAHTYKLVDDPSGPSQHTNWNEL